MKRYTFELTMKNGDVLSDIKSVGNTPEEAYSYLAQNEQARTMIDFDNVETIQYMELPYIEVDPNNYKFEESKTRKGWYVVTDLRYNIVTIFPFGRFNSDQKHTQLFDNKLSVSQLATIMRELGEYLYKYHSKECGS